MTETQTTWRDRQKLELREHLYQTALDAFRRDGYEPVTMAALAEQAGVAKGTFFNHFPAKSAVLQDWYLRESRAVLQAFEGGAARFEDIPRLLLQLAKVAEADPRLWEAKIAWGSEPGALRDAEAELDTAITALLVRQLLAGQSSGVCRQEIDRANCAFHLLSMLTQTARGWAGDTTAPLCKTLKPRIAAYLDLLKV